jgi:hypothetical protein
MKDRLELIAEARLKAEGAGPREVWYLGSYWERGAQVRSYMVMSFSNGHQYYQDVRERGTGVGYCYAVNEPKVCITCTCPLYSEGHKPCKHAALVQMKLEAEAEKERELVERAERVLQKAEKPRRDGTELARLFTEQGA